MTAVRDRASPLALTGNATRAPLATPTSLGAAAATADLGATAGFRFPPEFLFGAAVAGYQVERGLHQTDWHQWEKQKGFLGRPRIANGDRADDGPDFVHLEPDGTVGGNFRKYIEKAKQMGHNAFRFSIEWSRIQPTKDGPYDPRALAMYHQVLDCCREHGLTPMVTLQHYALPSWVHDVEKPDDGLGGWAGPRHLPPDRAPIIDRFARFAGDMAREFGHKVDLWCTVNEPSGVATTSYLAGIFPGPGRPDVEGTWRALIALGHAHARAYDAIKANDTHDADGDGKAAQVGMAQSVRIFVPWRAKSDKDRAAAEQLNYLANVLPLDAAVQGTADWNGDGDVDDPHDGTALPELKDRLDFVGINYYSRTRVGALPVSVGWKHVKLKGAPLDDLPLIGRFFRPRKTTEMGWETYPEGLHQTLLWAHQRYGKPLYVTENGVAESAQPDVERPKFIVDHLREVQRAMQDGADVRGYLHWSLMDNFEWASGFRPRFGLLRVDYTQPDRPFTETQGARAYSEVIRAGGVTPQLEARWGGAQAPDQRARRNSRLGAARAALSALVPKVA